MPKIPAGIAWPTMQSNVGQASRLPPLGRQSERRIRSALAPHLLVSRYEAACSKPTMQSEAPLTLILSPLRAGRGDLARKRERELGGCSPIGCGPLSRRRDYRLLFERSRQRLNSPSDGGLRVLGRPYAGNRSKKLVREPASRSV